VPSTAQVAAAAAAAAPLWKSQVANGQERLPAKVEADPHKASTLSISASTEYQLGVSVRVEAADSGPAEPQRFNSEPYEEFCARRRVPSPRRIADDEIPSALASVKSLRQSIDVLREQQQMQVDVMVNQKKPEAARPSATAPATITAQATGDVSFAAAAPSNRAVPALAPSSMSPQGRRSDAGHEEEQEQARTSDEEKESCVTEVGHEPELRPPPVMVDMRADLAMRQDQQEVRIHALNTKIRLLEQALNAKLGKLGDAAEVNTMRKSDFIADKADASTLDNELDAFRKELKAEQMEHSLAMVQESNTLRSDVLHAFRISLSNEREARCRDIADVRSAIEVVQDKLMQDLHMTMDLVGARLEDHLQEAVRPQALCAKLAGRAEFQQLLQDTGFQAAPSQSPVLETRSNASTTPDDMVLATASAVEELAKKLHAEQEARAKGLADLRDMFVHEVSALQADVDSSPHQSAAIVGIANSIQTLKADLEAEISTERKIRSQEDAQLQKRLESTAAKLEAASSSMEAATAAATSTLVRGLDEERSSRSAGIQELRQTLFDVIGEMRTKNAEELARRLSEEGEVRRANMQELKALSSRLQEEKARIDQMEANLELAAVKKADAVNQSLQSEREARTNCLNELRTRMERDAADLRHRVEDQALKIGQTSKQEREERLAETAEIRSMLLDLVSRQVDHPRDDESSEIKSPGADGEILTLYGMVKEALGDTVRLSMEIEEERKQRREEVAALRKQAGVHNNVSMGAPPPAREVSPRLSEGNVVWPLSSKTQQAQAEAISRLAHLQT